MNNNRIFISSTCYDLIDLRAELKEYISSLGLTPVLSDHSETKFSTFANENSIETCLTNLRSCDVVIIILSQRYGPSLKKAGFPDYSATHLEYLEAKKENKKIIFFIRDRTEADYKIYKKHGDINNLDWIGRNANDIKIFNIIDSHKALNNDNNNNWYWTFKNSIEVKQRLKIDLEKEININRLNQIINNGNCPSLIISADGTRNQNQIDIYNSTLLFENFGNKPALEPVVLVFKSDSYENVLKEKLHNLSENIEGYRIHSIRANSKPEALTIEIKASIEELNKKKISLIIEVIYQTIEGDILSDISSLIIEIENSSKPIFKPSYTTKRYFNNDAYDKIVLSL
jgi:hypothetical protein